MTTYHISRLMKPIRLSIIMGISLIALSLIFVGTTFAADAVIDQVWVDHNIYQDGIKGMTIHAKFTVEGLYQSTGHIAAYFYYSNGDPLLDFNGRYDSADGKVSVGSDFSPGYENTLYSDFELFIPYDELHMADGEHNLKLQVLIFQQVNGDWQSMVRSDYVGFQYRTGDIDYESENVPETTLASGFTPDPFTRYLSTNIFGGFEVDDVSDCAGFVSPTPDFRLQWSGTSGLRFYFVGDTDTVMLINDPSGNYYCNDDSFDTLDPTISFSRSGSGQYDVWIGTYEDGGNVNGTLYVTEIFTQHP